MAGPGRKELGSRRPGQKEKTKSRAAMSRRKNGKRKDDGKMNEKVEEGRKFCKLFMAPESRERLIIPPAFSHYLQKQPTGLVSLKGQSGNTWTAELASDTKGLFFGYGWKKFVMDHSIETGHILTFCYHGRSQFSVVVFDGMCIEKPSAFHAMPSNDLVEMVESDKEDNEITDAPQEGNNGTNNKTEGPGASVGYKSPSLNGTKAVVEVQRVPEATSQRMPVVSEEQKNCALQKAKQYKSKYPITLEIMKDTNVYKSFFMIIQRDFVRDYLPRTDKKFTLWDPLGKAWEVTYVYCSKRSAGGFSKGWGKFSVGNHLEKFDVCVFELFSEDNIRVHIYRANSGVTPYILESEN